MAMQLDLTTVFRTKCRAVIGATVTDVTTKMRQYIDGLLTAGTGAATNDINRRVWDDLPKT